ncbi:hypothetical protein Tco_1047012 [Tanacetum coccineum]
MNCLPPYSTLFLERISNTGNLLSLHSHSSLFLVAMGRVGDVRRWWVGLVEAVFGSDGGGEAVRGSDGGGDDILKLVV